MSTTIGNVVLTYDVNSKHVEVKNALKAKGYMDRVQLNTASYTLPSTTLWKQNGSTDQAISDIQVVCKPLGVVLQNAVSVLASDWKAL